MPISFKKEILTYLDKKKTYVKIYAHEPLIDLNKEKQALIETNEAGVKLKAPFQEWCHIK